MAALIICCAFALALCAQPQDTEKVQSLTGCLRADGTAPKTYQLTDVEKGPKSVAIMATRVELGPHLGHKIEITGTDVPAEDAEWAASIPKHPLYMKVNSIKMI